MRAVTFDEATAELRKLGELPLLPRGGAAQQKRAAVKDEARVDAEEVALLRQYLQESVGSIKRARTAFRQLGRPDLPQHPGTYERLSSLLERLERAASL